MASTSVGSEASAAVWASPAYGAGQGAHLPVGTWGSTRYRSMIRFPVPSGWQGWTSIDSATITFYITDFQHVGIRNSQIYCRRMNVSGGQLWTKGAGSQSCESGFSASNTTQWSDTAGWTSNDQVQFSSGTTANRTVTLDITAALRYYWSNNAPKIVFGFDQVSGSDYTEIWSDQHSNSVITINYSVQSPPTVPTNLTPAAGSTVTSQTPTFGWTHNDPQGDAQAAANVQLYTAAGAAIGSPFAVSGAANTLVCPSTLTRGTTYQFAVQTSDAGTGTFGPYSALQSFTVAPLPVVSIATARVMSYDAINAQPRLVVSWTSDQSQSSYRVQTASGYDSGTLPGSAQSHTLARNLTNGTAETVTVTVTTGNGLAGQASQAFTPRWGLTVQRRDLTAAPVTWGTPAVLPASQPAGTSLIIEYGSNATAVAAPTAWYSTLSAVPKARYLFYRAWFIPSATAGPTLDKITIPTSNTVQVVDKWGVARDTPGLAAPWSIDTAEYVYGTRSITVDVAGAGPYVVYSYAVTLRAGRSYILTGLMKSLGNSGAQFQLQDAAGNVLQGGGIVGPAGAIQSPALAATTDWFASSGHDVNRYRTPIYVAPSASDITAYVVVRAGGSAGAKAWFDAMKLEESTVATPWTPGAVGAVIVDAGGVQVDGSDGGILRYRGTDGGARSTVEGGVSGLLFGGDTPVDSPAANQLRIQKQLVVGAGDAQTVLNLNTERAWQFEQAGAGAAAVMVLRDLAGSKTFRVAKSDQSALAEFDTNASMLRLANTILSQTGLMRLGGAAFPASPAANDQFYRTDLDMQFYFDGTRWLSAHLYDVPVGDWGMVTAGVSATAAAIQRGPVPAFGGGSDIWVVSATQTVFINGGTALSGSNSWTTVFQKIDTNNVGTTLATHVFNSGASTVWRSNTQAVNALLGSTAFVMQASTTKVGTPGNLIAVQSFTYRIVAT